MRPGRTVGLAALLFAVGGAAAAAQTAQSVPPPLTKSEVIRLLASPSLQPDAVADSVRTRCLSFRPTERDLEDFRALGAADGVLRAITGCGRPDLSVASSDLSARAGGTARVSVTLRRGGSPVSGSHLHLTGTEDLADGPEGQIIAVTDEDGRVVFRFPAGTRTGRYPLRVESLDRSHPPAEFSLLVTAAAPARASLDPGRVEMRDGTPTATIDAVVRDRFGNRVARVPVTLQVLVPGRDGSTVRATTNESGRARFRLDAERLAEARTVEVRTGERRLASTRLTLADLPGAELARREEEPGAEPPAEPQPPAVAAADSSATGGGAEAEPPRTRPRTERAEMEEADPADAVRRLEEAADANPDDAELQLALARALERAGRLGAARDAYREAARRDPALEGRVRRELWRLAALPEWLEISALGGARLGPADGEDVAGIRAARLALRPVEGLQLHARYDRSLHRDLPFLVRGQEDVPSFHGGATVHWGPRALFSTSGEAGVRDPEGDRVQYTYRLEQRFAFASRAGPAILELGGFLGRWFDRDDWALWTRLEWPVDDRLTAIPALYHGHIAAPPFDVPLTGGVARETRGYVGFGYRPVPAVELRPSVGLGSVDRDDGSNPGAMVDLLLEASARITGQFRLETFLRHQRPPDGDPFTEVVGGFSIGFDPPRP